MKFFPGLLLWVAFHAHAADIRPFDAVWRFLKSDAPGAEAPAFDDAAWRMASTQRATNAGCAIRHAPKWPFWTRSLGQPTFRFTAS